MDLAKKKGVSRTYKSKPQGIRSTVRPHTLTKKWPIIRQGPPEITPNITKPAHLDKKSQDSLTRCRSEVLFVEKITDFQTGIYTFAVGFIHFGRDAAEDCCD